MCPRDFYLLVHVHVFALYIILMRGAVTIAELT